MVFLRQQKGKDKASWNLSIRSKAPEPVASRIRNLTVPTRVYEPSSNGVNLAFGPTALTPDPAESGPFAGNARFCGRGGQIAVGWRPRTAGMKSVRRMSKGFSDCGTIARRAFPDAAYAALERMCRVRLCEVITQVEAGMARRGARGCVLGRARGRRRSFG